MRPLWRIARAYWSRSIIGPGFVFLHWSVLLPAPPASRIGTEFPTQGIPSLSRSSGSGRWDQRYRLRIPRHSHGGTGFAKLSDRKTPLTAADLLNDRVVPFFEQHGIPLNRVLTDRGTEYCGAPDRHEYELYLAVENMDHTRTKTKSPQTNGICERFHKTLLHEFYRVAFRKKIYRTLEELQADLDAWLEEYNERRPHQGRWCYGKTPMQTFLDSVPLAKEKVLAA